MAVLVLAEHSNSALNDATAKTVAAAKAFGGDVDVLVAGHNAKAAADAAAKLSGVRKVLHADAEPLAHALAEAVEAGFPQFPVTCEPGVELAERFRPQRIEAALSVGPHRDEA